MMLAGVLLLSLCHLSDAGLAPTWDHCGCRWAEWSAWSECSVPCGGGYRFRSRDVWNRNYPECNGYNVCASDDLAFDIDLSCNRICFNGSYSGGHCQCQSGWYGRCCKKKINCGNPGDLKYGTVQGSSYSFNSEIVYRCDAFYNLTDGTRTRRCLANSTWSGKTPTCAFVNSCQSNPCKNDGICTNKFDSYNCHCAKGFNGSNCELVVNSCQSNPCKNDGKCTNKFDSYNCHCAKGFNGSNCELEIKCGNPGILKHGSIEVFSYTYNSEIIYHCDEFYNMTGGTKTRRCQANATWSGKKPKCAFVNSCRSNPCKNQGTCVNGIEEYTCLCNKDFNGSNCELNYTQMTTSFPHHRLLLGSRK